MFPFLLNADKLHWWQLGLALVPPLIVTGILFLWQLDGRRSLLALARMVLQLSLVGFTLGYVFQYQTPWVILFTLTMMMCAGSWIAMRHLKTRDLSGYLQILTSLGIAGTLTYVFLFAGVLQLIPWLHLKKGIPLAGMIFANGMNAISLASDRFYSEIDNQKTYQQARNIAYSASLIPMTNAMMAVGLVSLPGMMTGNLIAGLSAEEAVKNQIMIMCMVYASAGLSSAIWLQLERKRVDDYLPK